MDENKKEPYKIENVLFGRRDPETGEYETVHRRQRIHLHCVKCGWDQTTLLYIVPDTWECPECGTWNEIKEQPGERPD
jgi:predicted RNA-binding Zn-ribbon protein involved in translation (DUF1610 family)